MSGSEYTLKIPEDHWLKTSTLDELKAFLDYYKINYRVKGGTDKQLYQLYILRAAQGDPNIKKLTVKAKIDCSKYAQRKTTERTDSREKLVDVSNLIPIEIDKEIEKAKNRRDRKRKTSKGEEGAQVNTDLSEDDDDDIEYIEPIDNLVDINGALKDIQEANNTTTDENNISKAIRQQREFAERLRERFQTLNKSKDKDTVPDPPQPPLINLQNLENPSANVNINKNQPKLDKPLAPKTTTISIKPSVPHNEHHLPQQPAGTGASKENFDPQATSSPFRQKSNKGEKVKMEELLKNLNVNLNMNDLMKPPEFKDKQDEDIHSFLCDFETDAAGYGWDETTMINKLLLALKGKARELFDDKKLDLLKCKSWVQAKQLVTKVFQKSTDDLTDILANMQWKDDKDYKLFIKKYQKIKFEINPNERPEVMVNEIIKKLPKDLHKFIADKAPESLEQLEELLKKWLRVKSLNREETMEEKIKIAVEKELKALKEKEKKESAPAAVTFLDETQIPVWAMTKHGNYAFPQAQNKTQPSGIHPTQAVAQSQNPQHVQQPNLAAHFNPYNIPWGTPPTNQFQYHKPNNGQRGRGRGRGQGYRGNNYNNNYNNRGNYQGYQQNNNQNRGYNQNYNRNNNQGYNQNQNANYNNQHRGRSQTHDNRGNNQRSRSNSPSVRAVESVTHCLRCGGQGHLWEFCNAKQLNHTLSSSETKN